MKGLCEKQQNARYSMEEQRGNNDRRWTNEDTTMKNTAAIKQNGAQERDSNENV